MLQMHVKRKAVRIGWMWMLRLNVRKMEEARHALQMEAVLPLLTLGPASPSW
jgi:hypothetical protein